MTTRTFTSFIYFKQSQENGSIRGDRKGLLLIGDIPRSWRVPFCFFAGILVAIENTIGHPAEDENWIFIVFPGLEEIFLFSRLKKQVSGKRMLLYAYSKSKNQNRAVFDTEGDYMDCGSFSGMKDHDDGMEFIYMNSRFIVRILDEGILKITVIREGQFEKDSPAIFKRDWSRTSFEVSDEEEYVKIKTSLLEAYINKNKFSIYIKDSSGVISEDNEKAVEFSGSSIRCSKAIGDNEKFYGFGEKTGPLNKRGWDTVNWNTDESSKHDDTTKCLYASIPFFIGLRHGRAYGLYFDNTYKTYFNMGKDDSKQYYFVSEGGGLSYYFIYGPSLKEVIKGYTGLTGRMKIPPLWTLGYQQCRWSYYPESRVLSLAKTFRKKDIPCDVIYLDIDYMDGYRVFTWDREGFPDFQSTLHNLHELGFKVVTIIDPGVKVDKNYDVYNEGIEKGYFCKTPDGEVYIGKVWPMDSVFPDFSREEVRNWWGKLNRRLIDVGVDGIWNDMNEPSVFDTPTKTMPEDIIHGDGLIHKEFHNLYGMMMDIGTYGGIRKYEKRPFLLTRSAFAGIQRYSALWTGDNMSLWEHLKLSIPMNCSLGLSGVCFTGSDVGGFAGNCSGELLARWTELGAFLPLFRNHSAIKTNDQEPWAFGEEIESICRRYIKLRYRLLPYLYNLFYRCALDGSPIIRPMVYEFQSDDRVLDMDDQFMFGDSFLAAPILESGIQEREVYLPGGRWVDYWTDEEYDGGRFIKVPAPLDVMPVFVKKGSIIPEWAESNYTGERQNSLLYINIYPDGRSEYEYYEDDGRTFDYEVKKFNLMRFVFEETKDSYMIHVSREFDGYNSETREYVFNIINSFEIGHVECIDGDGQIVNCDYTFEKGIAYIKVPALNRLDIKVNAEA